MTDLSIIIVSYRGWDRLALCLDSLERLQDEKLEIIIADNNSGDGKIVEIQKRFPQFRFIINDVNGGFGYGCNSGAAAASGEYLLFLNPDTVASDAALRKLLNTARENPGFTILSCRQVNGQGRESRVTGSFPSFRNITGLMRTFFRQKEIKKPEGSIIFPDWVSGSVIMISKQSFISLGGFDEDYWMYYEDVDICKRVSVQGGTVALAGDITIEHNHGGSSRINLETTSLTKTEVHISRHVYISKHKKGAERMLIQAFMITNNLITGIIMALAGLLFFFVPKIFSRTIIFIRLARYYLSSLQKGTWLSPRSVNYQKHARKIQIPQ